MPPLTSGFCSVRAATCACPLRSKFPLFVPPEGDMDGGGVVIMGEAGGETEGIEGRPFVGRTGKELRGALSQIEVPIDAIYNMVPRALRQHTPSKREVQACWDCHVGQWLTSLQPSLIVAVGGVAAGYLAGVGVERYHGSPYPCVQPGLEGVPVFVTFHPSAMVRNRPKYQALFEGDYTALEAYYHGTQHLDRTQYTIDDIQHLRGAIESQDRVVLDFETPPIGTENLHVIGVAVRTPERTRYFHGTPSSEDFAAMLRGSSVWYNGTGFDLRLFPGDLKYAEVDDVFIKAKVLQKPFGSLRDLAAYEFGLQHEGIKQLYSRTGGYETLDPTELAMKACEDVELTDKLDVLYTDELTRAGLWPIYLLERSVAPLVRRTEDYGMHLDHGVAIDQLWGITEELRVAEATFQSMAPVRRLSRIVTTTWAHLFGPLIDKWKGHGRPKMLQEWTEPVNPRSPQQLVEMFDSLGVPLTERTDTGQLSVAGDVLEAIEHPVAAVLRAYRKVEKREQFVSELVKAGEWITFRLKALGAVSGRFSSGAGEEAEQ